MMKQFILLVSFITMCSVQCVAQKQVTNLKQFMRCCLHLSPVMIGNKGAAVGVGFEKPLANRWLYGADVGYKYMGFLDREPQNATGVQASPFIQYFVNREQGVTGICFGFKPQILLYNIRKSDWITVNNTGELSSFTYRKLTDISASIQQYGGSVTFGLRKYSMSKNLYFRFNFDVGAVYTIMDGYTEGEFISNSFINLQPPLLQQFNGWNTYYGVTLSLGLVIRGAQPEYSL